MSKFTWSTTADFIANGKLPQAVVGDVLETAGYTTEGDGGRATWKLTATTGTASQSPAQLGNALFNDANGNQWALVNSSFSAFTLGYVINADFLPIFTAAQAHSISSKATFVFENIDHLISGSMTILSGFKCEVRTDSKISPFAAYTGDAVIFDSLYDSASDFPRITDFTTGAGVTLFGSNLADIKINRIARCLTAVKLKTVNSGLQAKLLDSRIDVMFIATCTNGILIESDNFLNVMQGNEVYVNFITATSNAVVFEDNGTHTEQGNWDSNVIKIQAFDPIGLTVQKMLVNNAAYGVQRLTFTLESWLGGFDGPNPRIIEGEFNECTFTLSLAEPMLRGWMPISGRQNTIITRGKMDTLNTPIALNTASNPATFNGGAHLFKSVSLIRLTSIADVGAGQTLTFYAYHIFLGGQGAASRGKTDSYITVKSAIIKPYVPLVVGYSNSINVENEIIIRWTNTTNATIVAGEVIDLFIEVK